MRAPLGDALEASRTAELRTAARALLRTPLLRPGGSRRERDAFVAVRRHERVLRDWFDAYTGWRLVLTPEAARLLLVPPDPDDATHPLVEVGGGHRPFTRRRYVLLCLALAALERADTQITLGRLADDVVAQAGDPQVAATGVAFRLESREERLDLVAVVRRLLDWGVLGRVAGAEDGYVSGAGDVLYDVERRVLALLLVAPPADLVALGATEAGAPASSGSSTRTPGAALSEEARTRELRHRLTRLLLCLPVVHLRDLTAEEAAYLTGQRAALTRRITELTGLVAEVRAEGIAMVDPDDSLTDVKMPESGTDGHLALLLAEHLAREDAEQPGRVVPLEELHALVRELALRHANDWRRETRLPGAEVELVSAALERLAALRLVVRHPAGHLVRLPGASALPALHRYAVTAPTRPTDRSTDRSTVETAP